MAARPFEFRIAGSRRGLSLVVVLDLVNPVGAGRGLVGGGWEAGFDEALPVGRKPLTHTLDQHAANLGGRGQESNRNAKPISGLTDDHRLDGPCTIW